MGSFKGFFCLLFQLRGFRPVLCIPGGCNLVVKLLRGSMDLSPAVGHLRECPHSETRYLILSLFPPWNRRELKFPNCQNNSSTTIQRIQTKQPTNRWKLGLTQKWFCTPPTNPNLSNQTKPTKPNLPNQTKPTKPNLQNPTYQTYKTKATKPDQPKQGFRQDSEAATIKELTDQSKRIF